MCVACRRRRPQRALVRLTGGPNGVTVDHDRRLPGRGAYVCPEPGCIDVAGRRGGRAVRHALRTGSESEVAEALAVVPSIETPEERSA